MQVHEVKPNHKNKDRKRKGRGDTYAGQGGKGQKSRAGRTTKPLINDLIKKFPKLRGAGHETPATPKEVVNVSLLDEKYDDGDKVTPRSLLEKNLIDKQDGKVPKVKILGDGKIETEVEVKNCNLSETAEEKIKEAGGSIK